MWRRKRWLAERIERRKKIDAHWRARQEVLPKGFVGRKYKKKEKNWMHFGVPCLSHFFAFLVLFGNHGFEWKMEKGAKEHVDRTESGL